MSDLRQRGWLLVSQQETNDEKTRKPFRYFASRSFGSGEKGHGKPATLAAKGCTVTIGHTM